MAEKGFRSYSIAPVPPTAVPYTVVVLVIAPEWAAQPRSPSHPAVSGQQPRRTTPPYRPHSPSPGMALGQPGRCPGCLVEQSTSTRVGRSGTRRTTPIGATYPRTVHRCNVQECCAREVHKRHEQFVGGVVQVCDSKNRTGPALISHPGESNYFSAVFQRSNLLAWSPSARRKAVRPRTRRSTPRDGQTLLGDPPRADLLSDKRGHAIEKAQLRSLQWLHIAFFLHGESDVNRKAPPTI